MIAEAGAPGLGHRGPEGPRRPTESAARLGLVGGEITDRLPPQNLEAEKGVLGGILLDNEVLHDVVPVLEPKHFYRDSHEVIYKAILGLYELGKPVDTILLEEELRRDGALERVGGLEAIVDIVNAVPHAVNARYYAQVVREKATARELIGVANEILKEGYANDRTAAELLASAEARVFAIAEENVTGETCDLRDVAGAAVERITRRAGAGPVADGVGTGFADLDEMTGGLRGAQLVILAARPSMGKTACALNICEHVAVDGGLGVLFVSLEMGETEIAERFLVARARVDGHKVRTGRGLSAGDIADLGRAYDEIRAGAPLMIDDTPARTMLQITANARRLKLRRDVGLVVVDYIQLVDSEEARDSRQEQIARISRRLKTLSRELDVPVIALSQLNRAVETREDRKPRMSDLRESGAIEQDADLVLLLHRPEYYDPNDRPGEAELIVAKNRAGATGTVNLTFLKNVMRFADAAHATATY